MKKVFVFISLMWVMGIYTSNAQCCSKTVLAQNQEEAQIEKQIEKDLKVEAYYFHFARRCVTCRTVERVSTETLQELYGKKIELKRVSLDEKAGEELAKKLGVEGQSLLFVNGTKKIDLTVDGFMYAQSDPDKFKKKIKDTVESLK
jgi:hypothetical protein